MSATNITTSLELRGLEPDNLLAFLALLGTLRSLETARLDWHPRLSWQGEPPLALLHVSFSARPDEIVGAVDQGVRRLGRAYVFNKKNITFTAEEFRECAESMKGDGERARLLAALGSDGVLKRGDDVVEATPLCAMLGQGHQDFLSRLAALATRDDPQNTRDLSRALFERWLYEDDTESFRWDPIEDRRYALQFGDPSENRNKIGTVTGANRLAAIGFGALVSTPAASGLATLGVVDRRIEGRGRRERDVCWPLVAVPTGLVGHVALLGHPSLGDPEKAPLLAIYGVRAVARARRLQVGKFFNFERARIQYL